MKVMTDEMNDHLPQTFVVHFHFLSAVRAEVSRARRVAVRTIIRKGGLVAGHCV